MSQLITIPITKMTLKTVFYVLNILTIPKVQISHFSLT